MICHIKKTLLLSLLASTSVFAAPDHSKLSTEGLQFVPVTIKHMTASDMDGGVDFKFNEDLTAVEGMPSCELLYSSQKGINIVIIGSENPSFNLQVSWGDRCNILAAHAEKNE
ncbi:hypothetical protein CZ809_02057 [Photobacterium piscicola]|uniref:Uncharacterized protein n=2 Tax=Photobacterium piscicola TaxID=1378299 RepID=A0A1T5I0E8_9GAMM|nr:hypothetical protein CZ809_02057 [Photobacterium piscicola]